jgi:hypothetical protein
MKGIFDELREANNNEEIGNELKNTYLDSIDTPKNPEGYYIDAFDSPISFNGIRTLKREHTKLSLSQQQMTEIIACHKDYYYFRRNYCKIVTKKGINRPEPRDYQKRLEDALVTGDDVLAFWPRQSGKSVTISTYLLWKAITTPNINIGIAANVQKLAAEVLDKIKKIFIEMPIWLQPGIVSWNKGSIEFDNGTKIMTSATNSDSFRGYSIHLLYVDEVAFIGANLWEEFADSVFPAQEALMEKQTLMSSTAGGLNHWYHLVEGARKKKNGYLIEEADWTEVPRWKKDGSLKTPEEFKREIIAKSGQLFFEQNFGNSFLGSSSTLISGSALKQIEPMDDDDVLYDEIFEGLRIFEEPIPGHHYILTSDPKKDGIDAVGMHVIDVTKLPFKQVAAANVYASYLIVPGRLFDLGNYYNQAMVVCENNVGESIPSTLFYNYEYEGEVFVEKRANGKLKNEMGIRTTTKTKRLGLTLLKKFIEEGKLIINDRKTLDELFNFIEKKKGTYAAEEGYHDDLVMSLMLAFAPFLSFKDFDDFKGFVEYLEKKEEEQEKEEEEFEAFLDLGFSDDVESSEPAGFTPGVWEADPFNSFNNFEH